MVLEHYPQEKDFPSFNQKVSLNLVSLQGTVRSEGVEGKLKEKWKNRRVGQALWPLLPSKARFPYPMGKKI